jgi:hypothetical protein
VIRSFVMSVALIAFPCAALAETMQQPAPTPIASLSPSVFSSLAQSAPAAPGASPTPEPSRRANGQPAPMDAIFPNAEYGGPLLGVNVDPAGYPLESWLARATGFGRWLDKNRIRAYGWINPGAEFSNTSSISTFPISYNPVPNRIELDQFVLRLERDPDTVQQDHLDWGFRVSAIYGTDYRWTAAQGFVSDALLTHNRLNGFDDPETFLMLYAPHVFPGGTIFELGRVISIPDIEAQLAPQNYLYSHSLFFDWDSYTQTGLIAWSKLSNMFSLDYGITYGDDVAPWNPTHVFPTGQLYIKYTTKSNRDYVFTGISAYNNRGFSYYTAPVSPTTASLCAAYGPNVTYVLPNGQDHTGLPPGQCLYGHDNLQQANLTWYHTFNKSGTFHNAFETYYLWTHNAPEGGTINNGPIQYGGGGGPGAFLPGLSVATGAVDYLEDKVSPVDFVTFRTDYMNDPRGWRSGTATAYGSLTLGLTHHFSPLTWIRPELRVERAYREGAFPYDNLGASSDFTGTKNYQRTLGVDLIQWF